MTTDRQQTFSMTTGRLYKEPCREERFILVFCENVQYVYIPYFNVTSGGISCSKGTPIIKKKPNPSLLSKEEQRKKKKKTKVLTQNKYMAMGPNGAQCQE
jgi:activator of 2-hydroxyglutaryl-CoA dehydratase